MKYLWSLVFLLVNLWIGYSMIWNIKWLIFNKKKVYIFRKKLFLTPGVAQRLKNKLMDKIRGVVKDYLEQANDEVSEAGYICRFEKKVFSVVYEKLSFIHSKLKVPFFIADPVASGIAFISKEFCSKMLREFVPYLYEYYKIDNKIDLLDTKLDLAVVESYYNKYVHKYLVIFNLVIFFIFGIINQVVYLCLP